MLYLISAFVFISLFIAFSIFMLLRLRIRTNYKRRGFVQRKLLWSFPGFYAYAYALMPGLTESLLKRAKDRLIETQLLTLLDAMSSDLSAGTGIQDSIRSCIDSISPPLRNELKLLLLLSKEHGVINALEHLSLKTRNVFLKILWISLRTHYKHGGTLVEKVKRLKACINLRINIRERIKAQILGVRVQFIAAVVLPYMLFLVMHLLYPELIGEVWNTGLGRGIVFFSVMLHSSGIWIFSRMIRFNTDRELNRSMLFEYMSFSIKNGISIRKGLVDIMDSGLISSSDKKIIEESQSTADLITKLSLSESLSSLAVILNRAYRSGISIASDLSQSSEDIMEKLEQSALRFQHVLPSRSLIPLFVCIFPATYLLILSPIIVEISLSII